MLPLFSLMFFFFICGRQKYLEDILFLPTVEFVSICFLLHGVPDVGHAMRFRNNGHQIPSLTHSILLVNLTLTVRAKARVGVCLTVTLLVEVKSS